MTAPLLLVAAALMVAPTQRRRLPKVLARRRTRRVPAVGGVVALTFATAAVGGASVGVATALLAATIWMRLRKSRENTVRENALRDLVAGLDTVIGELDVGAHPAAACESAAGESSMSTVYAGAAGRARLGGMAADAFLDDTSRCSAEIRRIGSVWRVAETQGLALSVLLDAVRLDLLGRRRFAKRTEASLAGARATAAVLAALPLVGVGLGQMMGASPLGILFGGGLGGVLLMIGVGLVCAGLLWTDAITDKVTS